MPCCVAVNCSNRSENGVRLHRFPSDPHRRAIWTVKVKRDNWKPTATSYLCEVHFDNDQYEQHRADGARRLKPNAVPLLFNHAPAVCPRKPPAKRGPHTSPRKQMSAKRVKVEHCYSVCPDNSSTCSPVSLSGSSMEAGDVTSEALVETPEVVAEGMVSVATTATLPCSHCCCLQKRYGHVKRANTLLRARYRAALRKIRRMSARSVAANKFLQRDQVNALCRNSRRGAKWSTATIKSGLSLHFTCGPTGYKELLSQNYPLPSRRTLLRSMQHIRFDSGVLSEVFSYLSLKVNCMSVEERECVLTLDEMSIKSSVELDNRTGHFIGDVTLPKHSGAATHALVFMLGGIATRWKQTVAYFLTGNSVDGRVLCDIVKEIIVRCASISLNVVAMTSDMGSANRAMWKMFGIVSSKDNCVPSFPHPSQSGKSVYVFADVPHLVKNLRNHITNGQDIVIPQDVVTEYSLPSAIVNVQPLQQLVEYQANKDIKPAPKLTSKLLEPSHFEKMKVSHAMAIFSNSVSAALRVMVDSDMCDKSALTTAWFLGVINRWFDLMSSRHPVMALSKFDEVKYTNAVNFLSMVNDLFRRISIGSAGIWKPVQSGVVLSTTSMLHVHDNMLTQNKFKFVLTARFSQDCLENLFSCIRRKNATPTALEFKNNLRVLTVAQYLKGTDTGSYEVDEGHFVAEFLDSRSVCSDSRDEIGNDVLTACEPLLECDIMSTAFDLIELNCLYYLGGYVVHCVKKHDVTCETCLSELCASETSQLDESVTKLVREKEYRSGCLIPCSQVMFDFIVAAEVTFRSLQDTLLKSKDNVKQKLVQEISDKTTDVQFAGCHNVKDKVTKRYVNARLQFFAKKMGRLRNTRLSKSSGHELSSKSMQMRKSVSKIK